MARGQGAVYRPVVEGKVVKVWWLDYSIGGKRHRESSGTTVKRDAQEILRQRIGDRRAGKVVGRPDRVTVHQLRELAERQYEIDQRRSKTRLIQCWNQLERFFRPETKAMAVTTTRLDDYAAARLAEGVARATVNQELAQLRRGFNLAKEKGLLAVVPTFKLPKVNNARQGFFSEQDLVTILVELPADVRDVIAFLAATGWRKTEARLLTWAAVDMEGGIIRLEGSQTKSGEGRLFPFGSAPSLKQLMEKRWQQRDGLYVFHHNAQAIGESALRYAWAHATKRAGLEGRLVHDLRRTFARDMRRAGVSEGETMKLMGHKTDESYL